MDTTSVDDALSHLGLMATASAGHGLLCGLICARGYVECDAWIALMDEDNLEQLVSGAPQALIATEGLGPRNLGSDVGGKQLQQLHRETLQQFSSGECDFYPLLPDDDEPLDKRTDALADWCQSFLFGLAAGGIKDFSTLPDQVGEISRDLVEFSQARHDTLEENEQDEFAHAELVEYIRIAVQLIFEELHASDSGEAGSAPSNDPILH